MKKLRNRFYLALIPLQLLLVGMVLWTIFLLNNLDGLVADNARTQKMLGQTVDEVMVQLDVMKRLLEERQVGGVPPDWEGQLRQAWDRYQAALLQMGTDERIASIPEMEPFLAHTQTLSPLIDTLTANVPDGVESADLAESVALIERAEALLGHVSAAAINNILGIQSIFQHRVRMAFYVLTAGIALGVFGTLLVSYQIGRIVVRPLEVLQQKLDEVREGNYDGEVHIHTRDEIGQLAGVVNRMIRSLRLYRNLTDQRMTNTLHTFRTVLQRSPHPVIFLDDAMTITYANPPADELLGSPEWANGLPDAFQQIAKESQTLHYIHMHRQLDEAIRTNVHGQPRYFMVISYPLDVVEEIPDPESSTRGGMVLTLQDVTKMKLADDLKGNLVATVSHELKTPLTSARMALYLLQEQQIGPLNEDQLDLVDTAKQDLERQLATIQNLLDLSRAQTTNPGGLNQKPHSLNPLVQEAVAAHHELADAGEIEVKISLPEQDYQVYIDAPKIQVVLNNLLSNALRHSPDSSTVRVELVIQGRELRCAVTDQGEGVEEDLLPKLFHRYSQGKKKMGSSGLGLHISKQIIEQHGGTIGCESEVGKGSTFFFTLPRMH